jgi:hypothetical protein
MAYINKLFAVGQASLFHCPLFVSACLSFSLIQTNREKPDEYKKKELKKEKISVDFYYN